MDFKFWGPVRPFKDIKPGTIFLFDAHNRILPAFKAKKENPIKEEMEDRVVALAPMYENATALSLAELKYFQNRDVIELSSAYLAPTITPNWITLMPGPADEDKIGALCLGPIPILKCGIATSVFDLVIETGQLLDRTPQGIAHCMMWEIFIPNPSSGGDPISIFRYPAP